MSQLRDLIYGRSPMSENSLLHREEQVDGGLGNGVDKMLEYLEGDTQQRDGLIVFYILWSLVRLKISYVYYSSQNF